MVRRSGARTSTFCHSLEAEEYFKYWSFVAAVALTDCPCIPATVTAPAFVMVASPDRAAAVNPVPSPITIWVVATAKSEGTPDELAFLTLTVLAAISASSALATPPSLIVMSPEDAAKFAELNDELTDQLNYIEAKLGNGRGSKQRRKSTK